MRMEKKMRITKKVRRKKTRNADNKNKQTNKQLRKEIFLSSSCHKVGPFTYIQNVMPIAGTVLYPVIPFINVTEIRTLRSSSLNARILGELLLWVFNLRLAGKVSGKVVSSDKCIMGNHTYRSHFWGPVHSKIEEFRHSNWGGSSMDVLYFTLWVFSALQS